MGEIIFLLVLIAISALGFIEAGTFPVSLFEKTGGPSLFPKVLFVGLAIFAVVRIIVILKSKEKTKFVFLDLFKSTRGVFILASVIYVLVMEYLGYIISTALFLIVICNYLYWKRYDTKGTVKSIVLRNASMVLITFLLYVFFAKVMTINLPHGLFGF